MRGGVPIVLGHQHRAGFFGRAIPHLGRQTHATVQLHLVTIDPETALVRFLPDLLEGPGSFRPCLHADIQCGHQTAFLNHLLFVFDLGTYPVCLAQQAAADLNLVADAPAFLEQKAAVGAILRNIGCKAGCHDARTSRSVA